MSPFSSDLWIGVGGAVERELDDVSDIWTAGWITSVNLEEGCVDVVYEDGSLEDCVPIDEIRSQPPTTPDESPESKGLEAPVEQGLEAPVDGVPPREEDRLALTLATDGAPLSPKKPAERSLAATLRTLRGQAKRLTQSVATLRDGQETQLARLSAACLGAARGMKGLRATRRALTEVTQRIARSAQHMERPLTSRKASGGEFDSVNALCEASLTSEPAVRPESRNARSRPGRAETPTSTRSSAATHRTARRARSSAGVSAMALDLEQPACPERISQGPPSTSEWRKPMSASQYRHASASVGASRVSKAPSASLSSRARMQHPLDWGVPGLSARPKFGGAF